MAHIVACPFPTRSVGLGDPAEVVIEPSPADIFEKVRPTAPGDFFEAEAAGLEWLAAAGGVGTAEVLAVSPGRIQMQRIIQVRPDPRAAADFGAALAKTHAAGAPAFGAPPAGSTGQLYIGQLYIGQLYIGSRPMPAASESSWGAFYARDRVLPFLDIAATAGTVTPHEEAVVRDACACVADGRFDDDEPPARIHGDLWSGNVLWSREGVVLIDPAAHGGHRETDLAMLALFGCPYLQLVIEAYHAAAPLRDGWMERVPLHQLHPLAVHAAGHGRSYGVALHRAAVAVLAL